MESKVARPNSFERMSYKQLAELRNQIDRLMVEKQNSARSELRQKMEDLAKAQGLSLNDVLGRRGKGKGTVAIKYRDPKNPENTWTGRGRMPRWITAATKGGKARKEDFLI